MNSFLSKSYSLIPLSKRKKIPTFFLYSFINTLLDFASIAFLVPIILILLDKNKTDELALQYLKINLDEKITLLLISLLIAFYIIKNIVQAKIIKVQAKYIYSISSEISRKLIHKFIFENYINYSDTDKNVYFRDVFQLPMLFSTHVLFSIYIIFSESIILLFIVIAGAIYKPLITLSAMLFLSFFVILLLKLKKKKIDFLNKKIVELYQECTKNIMNIFYGFTEIKSTRSEQKFEDIFTKSNLNYNNQLASLSAFKQINTRYFELLFVVSLSAVILFFMFNENNTAHLILLSFFTGASIKIIPSFNKILNSYVDIKANSNCVKILLNYRELSKINNKTADFKESIELKNCQFSFNQKGILNNVSLEINLGDFITIKGESGQGKSTLLHIIAGLITPKSGEILIDNRVVKTKNHIYDFMGFVSQQPFLFQGSLLDNITMLNHENVDYKHIEEIVSALDLSDWVSNLPNGLNTNLLLESKKISGGQKQRIALARALYFKPKVLLLDEATNQLNEALKTKIFDYLKALTLQKKLSVVAVSHGSKIHQFADKKYSLEKGKLTRFD